MIRILLERCRQGHHTNRYPQQVPPLPDRLRCRPALAAGPCPEGCAACAESCPTAAVRGSEAGPQVDLGRCLFCNECSAACPKQALKFETGEFRLAASARDDLHTAPGKTFLTAQALDAARRRLYGRSLKLRVVSAGGCNGCEVDVNVLATLAWDLGRFGIQYVASPRHADGMLTCGPVSKNMELATRKTWEAIPGPRVHIAVGACAISGGPWADRAEQCGGAAAIAPVDVFIPGCPPHPLTILDGLLRLVGRVPEQRT